MIKHKLGLLVFLTLSLFALGCGGEESSNPVEASTPKTSDDSSQRRPIQIKSTSKTGILYVKYNGDQEYYMMKDVQQFGSDKVSLLSTDDLLVSPSKSGDFSIKIQGEAYNVSGFRALSEDEIKALDISPVPAEDLYVIHLNHNGEKATLVAHLQDPFDL